MPWLPRLSFGLFALALAASACVSRAAAPVRAFICADGKSFTVRYGDGRALLTTDAGRWSLRARPSSIGRKFVSGNATFIHDEDRAALNGVPGGPFRRCREATAGREARNVGAALL